VRLAIVDTDFRGYETLIAAKQLPPGTRLVDLTTEKNPELYPESMPGDPKQLGHGTLCARAAAIAAPEADLVLVRIDGDDPEQVQRVIQLTRGDTIRPHMERRLSELVATKNALRAQRQHILEERQRILLDFTDDVKRDSDIVGRPVRRGEFDYLGAVYGWLLNPRDWSVQRLAWQDKEEQVFSARERRYWDHVAALQELKGITIVAVPLAWHDGYPLGG